MSGRESEAEKRPRNLGASIQQKLRNHAKDTGDDVGLMLTRYVSERFLYRLSVSPYGSRFILRGATLFTLWEGEPHRTTRDIDLLATGDSSSSALRDLLVEVCAQAVEPDGVTFLPETLDIEERAERRVYQGLHVEMVTGLGTARPRLEIDIAFGEAVTPPPVEADLPVLLGMPVPRLHVYWKETVVAEKCEALVSIGIVNTRMKDFYDLWYLSRTFHFDGAALCDALQATFTKRRTSYPVDGIPDALTSTFVEDAAKQRQWAAFLGKTHLKRGAEGLPELAGHIRLFLQPLLGALAADQKFNSRWSPDGFWSE